MTLEELSQIAQKAPTVATTPRPDPPHRIVTYDSDSRHRTLREFVPILDSYATPLPDPWDRRDDYRE